MTQKEYKENIERLKNRIRELEEEIDNTRIKNDNYERVLESYYIANNQLERERNDNINITDENKKLKEIIEQYKKILDKFTINY